MKQLYLILLLTAIVLPLVSGIHSDKESTKIKPRHSDQLHVMSYNMWGLPMWLPKVGINNRFDKACESLSEDSPDIICLQECFSKRLRKKVLEKLAPLYHYTMDYRCSEGILLGLKRDCHGGLMNFTKLPIIDEEFIPFPEWPTMKKTEQIGRKGFLITRVINQKADTMVIINTHLYAGQSQDDEMFRLRQILFMDSMLHERKVYQWLCMLSGDLNIDHPNVARDKSKSPSVVYNYVIENMQFQDSAPTLDNNCYTIDASRNFYSNTTDGKQKLDYILMRFPSEKEGSKWVVEKAGSVYANHRSYSDHLAWTVTYSL